MLDESFQSLSAEGAKLTLDARVCLTRDIGLVHIGSSWLKLLHRLHRLPGSSHWVASVLLQAIEVRTDY